MIRRSGCRYIVIKLRSNRMWPRQWAGEGDAGARNLCAGGVRTSERRLDCYRSGAKSSDRGNDRCLRVCTTVDRDRLTFAKATCAGDGDYGGACIDGGADRSGACCADSCNDRSLRVCACVNRDLLACLETFYICDFDVGGSGIRGGCEIGRGLHKEVGAVAVCVGAVREPACTLIDRASGGWPKSACRTGRMHEASE